MVRTTIILAAVILVCIPVIAQDAPKKPKQEEEGIFGHPEWPPPINKAEDDIVRALDDMKKCSEPHMRRGQINLVGELARNNRAAIRQPIIQYILDELTFRLSGGDYDYEVRQFCVEAIVKICDREGVDERIKYLKGKIDGGAKTHETPEDVEKAYEKQVKQAKKAVLTAIREDKKNKVRQQCAAFIPKIATDKEVVDTLIEALLNDGWSIVREAAVRSLMEIKDPACIPALKKALADDPYSTVREAAAKALIEFDVRDALPLFVEGLKDGWPAVKIACMEGLEKFGTEKELKHIMDRLFDKNHTVREIAVKALGRLGDGSALESLEKATDDEYAEVRAMVYEAIANIGKRNQEVAEKAADIIVKNGLKESSANPHTAAITGLLELGDRRGVAALLQIINGDSPLYKKLGAIDMAVSMKVKDEAFVKALKDALKDEKTSKHLREKIEKSLPELED